jgi:hypothetical protein
MPCQDDLSSHSSHTAKDRFPANFEPDTRFFCQALTEHNRDRLEAGLRMQDFSELSDAERHDVIDRAQKIKLRARMNVIVPWKLPPPEPPPAPKALAPVVVMPKQPEHVGAVGLIMLLAGVFILVVFLATLR